MATKTTYSCDRCGAVFDTRQSNVYSCGVNVQSVGTYGTTKTADFGAGKDICRTCLEDLGIKLRSKFNNTEVPKIVADEQEPATIETLIREIVREEVGNA